MSLLDDPNTRAMIEIVLDKPACDITEAEYDGLMESVMRAKIRGMETIYTPHGSINVIMPPKEDTDVKE